MFFSSDGKGVDSLAHLLAKYAGVKIHIVSPEADDVKNYLLSNDTEWFECYNVMKVASECDGIYVTRIEREEQIEEVARENCRVNQGVLNVMMEHAIVMHHLPRRDEIIVEVDKDQRAAYFRQAKNGLYIRTALIYPDGSYKAPAID